MHMECAKGLGGHLLDLIQWWVHLENEKNQFWTYLNVIEALTPQFYPRKFNQKVIIDSYWWKFQTR